MLKTIKGVYRNGQIELLEPPQTVVTDVGSLRSWSPNRLTWLNVALTSRRWRISDIAWLPLPKIGTDPRWTPTMPFSRGDVVLVLFPDCNLRTVKRGPALVVEADHPGWLALLEFAT